MIKFKTTLKKEEVINLGIILSFLSIVYILFLFPKAAAAPSLKDTVNEMIDFINSGASENIYNLFTDTYTTTALTFGTDFISYLKGLGSVVAIVIMVGKIEESLARGRGDDEAISEGVIALCICLLVVLYVTDILDIVNGLGSLVLKAMSDYVSTGVNTGLTSDHVDPASGTM